MKKAILLLLVSLSVLISCSTTKKASSVKEKSAVKRSNTPKNIVAKMQSKYPNYTVAELKQGRVLYQTHCKGCHDLKNPIQWSAEEWTKIVPSMSKKVNETKKVLKLIKN